jgi:Tfp pilus assembly protein PilO
MKKEFIIIALAFVALASLGYAFQQKSQIDEVTAVCEKEKQQLEKLAEQQLLAAREFQKMAVIARHQAEVQRVLAEEQLKALKSK